MIHINNLIKSFDETPILKGVSTTFEKGKTNLIIGQSGSGKTVFLKCIIGLFEATDGDIIFDNTSLESMDLRTRALLRQDIGMVFQGSALFDSMTVEENIMFPMKMFTDAEEDEIKDRANTVINRVNLIDANHKMPSEISGGMKKRVAIARAIIMNPKYLFCDEPNSGLDPRTAILIDNLIQEITQEYAITTVINTHDMNSVMEIGEKIVFLENGLKQWEGTNQEIFKTDNEAVTKFVYSSEMFKKIREIYIKESN
ncbi:ATP-binding cassette domain-containing protein [Flavobacteriaceae bacterium]|nr:ATP-binding cassette domain-containing protein [Flavobacteriaceae bacterium]MDB9899327.1 ATP-binding cassette domain-containing protein [Flavobacteriaceae bacterium]